MGQKKMFEAGESGERYGGNDVQLKKFNLL